jgi:acyl-CoA thioester hydrolase
MTQERSCIRPPSRRRMRWPLAPRITWFLVIGVMLTFVHNVRVRYSEVDMERIVFNGHYLAYVDDTADSWFRAQLGPKFDSEDFNFVVKKAVLTWEAPATIGDVIEMTASVSRWGRTSFDVTVDGSIAKTQAFTAVMTYVAVEAVTHQATPVPDRVRRLLSEDA